MSSSVFKYLRYPKVSQLNRVIPSQEDIRCLDISVENFPAVDVLEGQADLDEPVEDFRLCEELSLLLLSFYMERQITNYHP